MIPELNKIYQGDCLKIMSGWPDGCVDMIFTSPPYNLIPENRKSGAGGIGALYKNRLSDWYTDDMPEDKYQDWQKNCITEMVRICRGSIFYNHKIRYAMASRGRIYHPYDIVRDFPVWCEIIWDRCGGIGGGDGRYIVVDEKIYMIKRPVYWDGCGGYTNIWKFQAVRGSEHPCQFPEELPIRAIGTTTKEGMVILDPFSGSGTVACVAERMGRKWIGIEIEPKYVAIAQARIDAERAQGKLF